MITPADTFILYRRHGRRYQEKSKCEGIPMSICFSGLAIPCRVHPVTIDVSPAHPLIQLAQVIPWQALAAMVLPALQRTTAQGRVIAS